MIATTELLEILGLEDDGAGLLVHRVVFLVDDLAVHLHAHEVIGVDVGLDLYTVRGARIPRLGLVLFLDDGRGHTRIVALVLDKGDGTIAGGHAIRRDGIASGRREPVSVGEFAITNKLELGAKSDAIDLGAIVKEVVHGLDLGGVKVRKVEGLERGAAIEHGLRILELARLEVGEVKLRKGLATLEHYAHVRNIGRVEA